jgi:hypothetical protein
MALGRGKHLRAVAGPCRQKDMESTPNRRGNYVVLRIQKLELLSLWTRGSKCGKAA